jgi:hypothetical protein
LGRIVAKEQPQSSRRALLGDRLSARILKNCTFLNFSEANARRHFINGNHCGVLQDIDQDSNGTSSNKRRPDTDGGKHKTVHFRTESERF